MDKILGVLALALVVGMWYGFNYHFDDLLLWLGQNATEESSIRTVGPLGR